MNVKSFIPCRTCASKEGPKPGYYYVTLHGKQFLKECDCHINWARNKEFEIKSRRGNIWTDLVSKDSYAGVASKKDVEAFHTFITNFDSYKEAMVYLYGPHGTQKTTTAMWGAQELIRQGFSVTYTLMETLLVSLMPDFSVSVDEKNSQIQKFIQPDLLIIDESFDKRTTTLYKSGYQLPFLTNFLKTRYEVERKGIVFISNVLPLDIEQQGFGAGLQDLVARNVTQSTLKFMDKFIANKPAIANPRGLFE